MQVYIACKDMGRHVSHTVVAFVVSVTFLEHRIHLVRSLIILHVRINELQVRVHIV